MFPLFVARRYLLASKRHHTTGIISAIAVCGVALATAAMVVTLSVFNGFRDLVASLFTAFDPQLRISLVEGKTLDASDATLQALRQHEDVLVATDVLQDQALIVADGRQWVVTVKGVDDSYTRQTDIKQHLYGDGHFALHADVLDYGILGIRLAASLGLSSSFEGTLPLYAPRRGERAALTNPMQSFRCGELHSPGVVFATNQNLYDSQYILTSLRFTRQLFDREGQVSSLELRLRPGASLPRVQSELQRIAGPRFRVENRYQQQADTFRIMQVEKVIAYLFLTFILLVASFNIISSLSMLMLEKSDNSQTLRALGADEGQLRRIFLAEGWLTSGIGAAAGILIGLALCWAQQQFGLVRLGQSEGSFLVDAYPVSVQPADLLLVFATVLVVGAITVWLPVQRMTRQRPAA